MRAERETVSPEDVSEEDLASYIAAANTAISPFDLEIRSSLRQTQTNEQTTPERVYALVNTTSDPLTQLATIYTADEIGFIKRLLDAMFETNNTRLSEAMVVSGMQATQLARVSSADANRRQSGTQQQTQGGAAQSLSMSQAETILQQLVEDGWLEKSRKGFYSLSPRGLMELRGWLVATYNDEHDEDRRADKIKFCAACRDIITVVSISISRVYAFHADFSRANAAPTVIAPVDCTICALATSFACSKQNNVPFVTPHGRMTSLWAKKPSPRRISICRASDAAQIPSSRMVLGLARR